MNGSAVKIKETIRGCLYIQRDKDIDANFIFRRIE
jgi:hypothetical protein